MKKIILASMGLVLVFGYILGMRALENFVLQEAVKVLPEFVTVNSIQINPLSSLTIRGVQVEDVSVPSSDIFSADSIKINFNLWKGIKNKDLSAISTVILDKPIIQVKHFKDDTFNFLELLKKIKFPTDNANEVLGLDIDVRVKRGTVEYYDERGFGAKPFKSPNTNKVYKLNTLINYKDGYTKIKNFSGYLNKDKNKVFASGEIKSKDYWAKIKATGCEISKEINYFMPNDDFLFKNAEGDLEIVLKNNEVKKKTDLPIRFDVDYKSKNTLFKMAILTKDVLINEGTLMVNNNGILLKKLNTQIEGQQFDVNGRVDDFYKLKIHVNNSSTDLGKVEKFLPFLQTLKLRGVAKTDLSISTNEEKKVVITGNVDNYVGTVIGYSLDRGTLAFTFADNKVDLIFREVNAYKGVGLGYGYIEMKPDFPPYVSMVVDIRDVELYSYFKSEPFTGKVDLALRIDSYTENLNGFVDIIGKEAKAFGQDLLQARVYWQAEQGRTVFADKSYAVINQPDSVVYLNGHLNKDNSFFVAFSKSALEVDDFYFFYTVTGNYRAKANFEGFVSGVYNKAFLKDPASKMRGNIVGEIDLFEVTTPQIAMKGEMNVKFENGLSISVNMKNKTSTLALKVRVEDKKVKRLNVQASNLDMTIAKTFIKPIGIGYKGIVSCDITMFPDKNKLFLKDQGVTGSVYLSKAVVASQSIDSFSGVIAITGNNVVLSNARLVNKGTDVIFYGEYRSTSDFLAEIVSGSASSKGWLFFPAGIKGEVKGIQGKARNNKGKITFDLKANLQDALYRGVFLPDVSGRFVLDGEKISFKEVEVNHFKDSYFVSGSLYLKPLPSGVNPFDVQIKVIKGELENIFDLYNNIQINWRNKNDLIKKEAKSNISIFDKYNDLMKREAQNLYSLRGSNISQALDELKVLEQSSSAEFLPGIYGTLKGYLHISYLNDLVFSSDLTLNEGRYSFINAEEIRLLSALKGDFFDVSVRAKNTKIMNKDFEELSVFTKYYPEKDEIEIVNLFAKMDGRRTNDLLKGKINFKDAFKDNPNKQALDLYLFLDKDDIGILTIFNKMLANIKNQGTLLLRITGPFINPMINSEEATLRNFELAFAPGFMLRTPLKIVFADLKVKDSRIIFPKDMKINWQGLDTDGKLNEFICNGGVAFAGFLDKFAGLVFDLDINLNPSNLKLDIKDLFKGRVKLFDTSIKGKYTVAFKKELIREQLNDALTEKEKGPVFKTKIIAESGIYQIGLGVGGKSGLSEVKPPLLLDLSVGLGKDIQIVQKSNEEDLNKWFTNINITFEERPELLKVEGSLNTLDTEGIFKFSNGRIIFMNKIFNLMDRQKQREIFGAGSSEIGDNYVEIKMEPHPVFKDKRSATPYFNIKTFSEVQKSIVATDSVKHEDHLFVVFIQGPINDLNSFSIEHYKKGDSGYALAQGRIYITDMTSDQMDTVISYLVPAVFRPDFYRSILQEGIADNQEANAMLREYSASQINIWIDQQLRPFEQEIAKNMGLYDVNIQHDLGGELVNAMQIFQQREDRLYNESKENALSVEYVKDLFFKKLFVKVKTGISQDPTKPLLNMSQYELAWLLNDYLSLNYGNYNLNDIDTMYGAFSINANFIF